MLTDTAIKALRSQKKLYKVSDRDGMYVVVQPSGAIVFRYDYRLNGRRETLTLGRLSAVAVLFVAMATLRQCSTSGLRLVSVVWPALCWGALLWPGVTASHNKQS